jgi:hypothetical protein
VKLGSFKELAHIEAQNDGAKVAKEVPLSMRRGSMLAGYVRCSSARGAARTCRHRALGEPHDLAR